MRITKKRVLAAFMAVALVESVPAVAMADDAIKSQGNFNFKNGEAVFYSSDLHYLNSKVEEQITAVTEGKNSIANAIELKGVEVTSESTVPTFLELVSGINSIGTLGTAGVGDVLAGETFYTAEGYKEGKMQNWSGQTFELQDSSVSVNNKKATVFVPKSGYYDTASKLTFPFDASKFVHLTGNAASDQVLAGKTFHTDSEQVHTGTMLNYASKNQTANVSTNGSTGTVTIPAAGYYDASSSLTIDLGSYTQQVQDEAFYKIASLEYISQLHDVYQTVDCTGISGWQNLTSSNFMAVPTGVQVYVDFESGNPLVDFGGTLGNLNAPGRGLFEYDATTGQLKVYGNGTDITVTNQDVITLWYKYIDVYFMR